MRIAEMLIFGIYASMRATLSVSGRGLISLPAKLRQEAGIQLEGSVIAETTPEGILLKPAVTLAMEIYADERVTEFDKEEAELAAVLKRKKRL